MSEESPFDEKPPFDAEAIAAALAHVATAQGDTASVAALAVSVPKLRQTGYDDWNGGIHFLTLYLEVPIPSYGQLFHVREDIQKHLLETLRPMIDPHPHFQASEVFLVPADEAPADWRKQAVAWLRGEGINNQGRVRSDNIAARQCDGLLFRTNEEINLYRALKSAGVSFAPLPVFVRGGKEYRRIEPDFVIVREEMVAVIEVDGPIHRESPVEAHDRATMLVHEGAHVERVRASDCSTMEGAEVCAKRFLATLAKVRASR
jgi:hypothetical protein